MTQSAVVGGAETALMRIVRSLPAPYSPHVIGQQQGPYLANLASAGISCAHLSMPPPSKRFPFPFFGSVARLMSSMRKDATQLLHVNDSPAYPAPGLAARWLRIPRICSVQFSYAAAGLRWQLKSGFDHAIFPSEFTQRWAIESVPDVFSASNSSAIHNGLEPFSLPTDRVEAERAALGLRADTPLIGFFGRVIADKGVDEYLVMASRIRAEFPEAVFLAVGDDRSPGPSYRDRMEARAAALGVARCVRFLGQRDDIRSLLRACDLVCMPSRVEPFGNVAMEAAHAGRPVVATRVGGIPEITIHGETGLLTPPGDADELASAVSRLLAQPQLRQRMGDAAQSRAARRFSLDRQIEKLTALYDRWIDPSRSVRARK